MANLGPPVKTEVGGIGGVAYANGAGATYSVTTSSPVRNSDGKIISYDPINFAVTLPLSLEDAERQIEADPNLSPEEMGHILDIANDPKGQQVAIVAAQRAATPTPKSATTPQPELSMSEESLAPSLDKKVNADESSAKKTKSKKQIMDESAYPNPLHNYASYTYNLSLHHVPINVYNAFATEAKTGYKPDKGTVLVASAGRWPIGADGLRNKNFDVDFFFEKLSFDAVIGSTSFSNNSNAISIDFTLIEPYGMTLINRLLDLTADMSTDDKQHNIMQLPFLIQIDFFGYDDKGQPKLISEISKFIPIQITGLKFKVSTRGAEYTISAVPYHHQAFSESVGTTPIKMQVTANSLKQFFASGEGHKVNDKSRAEMRTVTNQAEINKASDSQTRIKAYREIRDIKGQSADNIRKMDEEINKELTLSGEVKPTVKLDKVEMLEDQHSYTEALNLWQQVNKDRGAVDVPDEYEFELAEEFLEAKFLPNNILNKAMPTATDKKVVPQEGTVTNLDDSKNPKTVTTINQGTSVLKVISMAMLNSDYIHNQILSPDKNKKITVKQMREFLDKPLKWFQVVPVVTILGYDTKANRYAKRITYKIQAKELSQDKNKYAGQNKPKVIAKDYQYIYTGKNSDILNFDLNFDTQFYVVNVSNPYTADKTTSKPTSKKESVTESYLKQEDNVELTTAQVDAILNDIHSYGVPSLQPRTHTVATITDVSANRGSTTEMVKQLERNILTTIGGDMIQVTLKIVGDPDFIKQDDIFFGARDITSDSKNKRRKTPNGSLTTDEEDLFVRLVFKTPVDYDKTGLAVPVAIDNGKNKYASSSFSGLYKITTVKNYFTNGKFEQELSLYRYALQPTDGIEASNGGSESEQREKK